MALYPLVFEPIYKERVWGGRAFERLYGRRLPADVPIGESWEVADRPGDESVIANGPFKGRTLRWLMEQHRSELLGSAAPAAGDRFPLLCKMLDARDKLSLQVHPPAREANQLGEPKTEMWHVVAADPGAELFVGLKRGLTREAFEQALRAGRVADCFHRLSVRAGDTMFLPSGRVHAIGAGLVIFEIQQNSDTTFRVHDWNRSGLDGKPRELHIRESLDSIDFADVEPSLVDATAIRHGPFTTQRLVRHALFDADLVRAEAGGAMPLETGAVRVVAVVSGRLSVIAENDTVRMDSGQFCVVPAALRGARLVAEPGARCLLVQAGVQ